MDRELRKVLERKVNVSRLLKRLAFTEETVVNAALNQAKLFRDAGILKVQATSHRINAETNKDMIRAQVGNIKRARIDKKDRTETEIKDLVARNPKLRAAVEEFNEATVEEQFAKMLLDAYDQRSWMISIVARIASGDRFLENRMKERAEELGKAYKNIRGKYE